MSDDLLTAPGASDLTFGSLLDEMIRHMFTRVESLGHPEHRRHYIACLTCGGTDEKRPQGQRPRMAAVEHRGDCLLAKHLPRLRAMAAKDVT